MWILEKWNVSVSSGVVCLVQGHMSIHREHCNKQKSTIVVGDFLTPERLLDLRERLLSVELVWLVTV